MVDARRKPVNRNNVRVVVSSATTIQGIELNNGVSMLIPRKRLVPLDPDFEQAATTRNYTCPHLHCPYSNYCLGFSTRVQRNHHMLHCLFRPNNNNDGGIIISQPHEQSETHLFQVPPPPQLVVEALANEADITNSVSSLLETGCIASQRGATVNSYSAPVLITPPASSMIMDQAIPEYSQSNITPPMKYKVMPDQHYYPTENNGNTTVSTTYGDHLSGVINNNNLEQEVVVTTQQQGFHLSAENGAGFDLDNISELQIDELLKDVYHLIN